MASKPETRNTPGHAHQLNFSCYRRLPLLAFDPLRRSFLDSLRAARRKLSFELWAYVIMPELVHQLVNPKLREYRMEDVRKAVKGAFARAALDWLARNSPGLHSRLILPNGSRRFWQDGKGYDRNLFSPKAIWDCVDYIHGNPVTRGLCRSPLDWPWSSARWFEGMPAKLEMDPCPIMPPSSTRGIWRMWMEAE